MCTFSCLWMHFNKKWFLTGQIAFDSNCPVHSVTFLAAWFSFHLLKVNLTSKIWHQIFRWEPEAHPYRYQYWGAVSRNINQTANNSATACVKY